MSNFWMRETHNASTMSKANKWRIGYQVLSSVTHTFPSWNCESYNEVDLTNQFDFSDGIIGTVIKKKQKPIMGIGKLKDTSVIFKKKKFRWACEAYDKEGNVVLENCFVKVAARPNIKIEETEVDFLSNKTWIPGKAAWESITITTLDGASKINPNIEKMDFLKLTLLDGCMCPIEYWEINGVIGLDLQFQDLDYSASEPSEVEMTIRYSNVKYTNGIQIPPTEKEDQK